MHAPTLGQWEPLVGFEWGKVLCFGKLSLAAVCEGNTMTTMSQGDQLGDFCRDGRGVGCHFHPGGGGGDDE